MKHAGDHPSDAILCEQLLAGYVEPIVKQVSFRLPKGQWLSIVGPNGAGKSTLLRGLLRTTPIHAGNVLVFGESTSAMSRRQLARLLAFVPASHEVAFSISVREMVAMGRFPHHRRFQSFTKHDWQQVDSALASLDVSHLAEHSVLELSAGERHRVMLARAFAQESPILLLDEPSANLDLCHQRQLFAELSRRKSAGLTMVCIMHDLASVAEFSDQVLVLNHGEIVAFGPPKVVLTRALIEQVFQINGEISVGRFGQPVLEFGNY